MTPRKDDAASLRKNGRNLTNFAKPFAAERDTCLCNVTNVIADMCGRMQSRSAQGKLAFSSPNIRT